MERNQILIILAIIIALVALGLSIYSTYSIRQINKKIAEIDDTITRIEPILENFEPLLPQIEILGKLLPQMQQFLLGIPAIPPGE